MQPNKYTRHFRDIASYYGADCTYERLLVMGSIEYNQMRHNGVIPEGHYGDAWIGYKQRVDGKLLEAIQFVTFVRKIKLLLKPLGTIDVYHLIDCARLAGLKGYLYSVYQDSHSVKLEDRFMLNWDNNDLFAWERKSDDQGLTPAKNQPAIITYLQDCGYYVPGTIEPEYVALFS